MKPSIKRTLKILMPSMLGAASPEDSYRMQLDSKGCETAASTLPFASLQSAWLQALIIKSRDVVLEANRQGLTRGLEPNLQDALEVPPQSAHVRKFPMLALVD